MPVTERTLRRWRRESLINLALTHSIPPEGINVTQLQYLEFNDRILRLTQDLMDIHLIKKN